MYLKIDIIQQNINEIILITLRINRTRIRSTAYGVRLTILLLISNNVGFSLKPKIDLIFPILSIFNGYNK